MFRDAILITCFGLIVGGCAGDRKIETVESSGGSTPNATGEAAVSSPAMSAAAATERNSISTQMSAPAATESTSMNQSKSSQSRIAAGVEEETLDTCLSHIPQDATAGQKMMAEQTCHRNYPGRR